MTRKKYDSYVICTSPRSGSTLLCKLLASTRVAGNPDSYFHRPSICDWLRSFDLEPEATGTDHETLESIFNAAISQGTLDTGMFGLRLQRHSFEFFIRQLAILHPGLPGELSRFQKAFGQTAFIHLSRRDKVSQAVSCVKAEQTGLWHVAVDGSELERVSPPQIPRYDQGRITACVEEMQAHDIRWKEWFTTESIKPLRITYESLAAQPIETLRWTLDYLGLDVNAAKKVQPSVAKMADEINMQWIERYRSACAAN